MNNRPINIVLGLLKQERPLYAYILGNVGIFLVIGILDITSFLSGNELGLKALLFNYLAFPAALSEFPLRAYTLITYQFLHRDLWHLLFNMLTLYWFGKVFADLLKPRQFHLVYFTGGIVGALLYLLAFNVFPAFQAQVNASNIIGSSASVMAIAAAAATLAPNYSFQLLFFGAVRLKFLVITLLIIDVLVLNSGNAGGSFAHIGGAAAGFMIIRLLQGGFDLSKWLKPKPKLRVVKNDTASVRSRRSGVSQEEIDKILDKISASGYDGLSAADKQKLFQASEKK